MPFVESISIPIVFLYIPNRWEFKSFWVPKQVLTYSTIYSAFSLFYFLPIPPRSSAFHHAIKVADISTIWADRTYPLEGKKRKIGRDLRCVVWWQLKEIPSVIIGLSTYTHVEKSLDYISVYCVIADQDYHLETMLKSCQRLSISHFGAAQWPIRTPTRWFN